MSAPTGFFEKIKSRLPPFARHALLLLSSTSMAQIIPAVLAPILTRQYRPEDFGVFALTYALLTIFAAVSCLRYELAIVLPESDEEAIQLVPICLALCLAAATVLEFACVALRWIAPGSRPAALALPLMAMLPVGIIFMGCQLVAQMWCVRTHNFRLMSIATVAQALTTIAAQIALAAVWGSNPYFLIAGVQLGLIVSVVIFAVALGRTLKAAISLHGSFAGSCRRLHQFIRFPIYTTPYVFVTQLASRGNLLLLATLTTTGIAGQFALAQRIVYFPISTVMASASQIFFSRAPGRMSDPKLHAIVQRILIAAPLVVGPPFLMMHLFAEPFFRAFFGANWAEAGRFAAILTFPALMITATAWMDRAYDILGRQRLALVLEIANNTVSLGAVFLVLHLTGSALNAVAAYAAATSVFYVFWAYVTVRIAGFPVRALVISLVFGLSSATLILGANAVIAAMTGSTTLRVLALVTLCVPLMAAGAAIAFYGSALGVVLAHYPSPSAVSEVENISAMTSDDTSER